MGGVAAVFIAWLLFPSVALMLAYVFAESVAKKVEARHYPGLPGAREESWWRYTKAGIRFEIVTIVLNLAMLPIVLIPFINIIYPVIFYGVNGYLFGREFLEIVAPRRLSFEKTRALRRQHRVKIIGGGVLIAVWFTSITPCRGGAPDPGGRGKTWWRARNAHAVLYEPDGHTNKTGTRKDQ
jgi:CysZ protein